jgi:hypothetical protein
MQICRINTGKHWIYNDMLNIKKLPVVNDNEYRRFDLQCAAECILHPEQAVIYAINKWYDFVLLLDEGFYDQKGISLIKKAECFNRLRRDSN